MSNIQLNRSNMVDYMCPMVGEKEKEATNDDKINVT